VIRGLGIEVDVSVRAVIVASDVAAVGCLVCLLSTSAGAQEPSNPQQPSPAENQANFPDCSSESQRNEIKARYLRLEGNVECDLPEGASVSADEMDVYRADEGSRILARGNVVFDGPEGHIAADELEYDTRTGLGTFKKAWGVLSIEHSGTSSTFAVRDPLVYFVGERLEKLGPRRYRVIDGHWTTCEQPTPRWAFTSENMVINLEDYVVARQTVLRVKNVPLFYTPYIYYPIKREDRATGFLMPTYGVSTYRGHSISNAFFWAIGRSHDATFLHDWFTRAGQGFGTEYRYVLTPASSGAFRVYRFARQQTESTENGVTTVLPASTSYEVTGSAVHGLGQAITARARVDYFSDVQTQQLLHQDVFEASRRNRIIEGGITAAFGTLSTQFLYQRNEIINNVSDTIVSGSTPRASATLAPRRLFQSPVYASLNADYAYLPQRRILDGAVIQDDSFGRLDVSPSVRVPLSRLSFLSVNTSAAYRSTYYSRQAGVVAPTQPGSYLRQYVSSRTDVIGPVFARIFDRPGSTFAERMKHVIEPSVTFDFTSDIPDFRRTPVSSDVTDFVVANSTAMTYGLTNRLFARASSAGEVRGPTREFITVGLQQTHYSKPEASRYDGRYQSGQGSGTIRDLSPVALTVRVSPTAAIDANTRIEYDVSTGAGMQLLMAGAGLSGSRNGVTLNYTRQRFGVTQPWSSFLTATARTRGLDDRLSASYSLNLDIGRSYIVSQGIVASYMAQCCGVQGEYQRFNYPPGSGLPIAADRRLNVSFVLSGVGTFSNFFGAFGGL
jgi:LPS-assembly protein